MQITQEMLNYAIAHNVDAALDEDIGNGDITALLIPDTTIAKGRVITRENATICGTAWVDAVFRRIDPRVKLNWRVEDGEMVSPNQVLFEFTGPARSLLTGERAALNFLQTFSGTATKARFYADKVAHTQVKLLDTRKTLPGMRIGQKYAVAKGGCFNHRIGLFDAFLIKENHIHACGSIENAVKQARQIAADKPVEVEVENLDEYAQAINAGADIIMLDNFSLVDMQTAVTQKPVKIKLEASGGINDKTLVPIAETGVDFISIGTLTKDCQSIDLSMRFN